jgi:DHA2 family multidrug resistance protein
MTRQALERLGQSSAGAAQIALGNAWQTLNRQAQMLSYQNAFWGLGIIIFLLIPLPFIMRRPPRTARTAPAMGEH